MPRTRANTDAAHRLANANTQAVYRQRHLHEPDTVDAGRINLLVSLVARGQLSRLAIHYGATQRHVLECLLLDAERLVVKSLIGPAQNAYYEGKAPGPPAQPESTAEVTTVPEADGPHNTETALHRNGPAHATAVVQPAPAPEPVHPQCTHLSREDLDAMRAKLASWREQSQ